MTQLERAALKALGDLRDHHKVLCRTIRPESSGFDYFTEPDHAPFPERSASFLIEHGLLTPQEDGLFPGMSQTFVAGPA